MVIETPASASAHAAERAARWIHDHEVWHARQGDVI